jgi:hypothetical protein
LARATLTRPSSSASTEPFGLHPQASAYVLLPTPRAQALQWPLHREEHRARWDPYGWKRKLTFDQIPSNELKVIIDSFEDKSEPKKVISEGVKVNGEKYMTIDSDNDSLKTKKVR